MGVSSGSHVLAWESPIPIPEVVDLDSLAETQNCLVYHRPASRETPKETRKKKRELKKPMTS
jgi:hypothetical protein